MKILGVDSSAKSASIALIEDGEILSEFFINVGLTHSQTLAPMVKNVLDNTNTNLKDLGLFAVSFGPGSFTGIRIGVSLVKGMAMPFNTPCIGVSTLYSMAFNLLNENAVVCAVMDARCNQVYNAIFDIKDGKIQRLTKDRAISIVDLYKELKFFQKKVIFVGDGAELCYNKKNNYNLNAYIAPKSLRLQRASSVAFAGYNVVVKNGAIGADSLIPFYLRPSQAERELKLKSNK